MKLSNLLLSGNTVLELDTEVRYGIATARADGAEVVCLEFLKKESEKETERIFSSLTKILRKLRREGALQFFVTNDGFNKNTTEAKYLLNKYSGVICTEKTGSIIVYVKT